MSWCPWYVRTGVLVRHKKLGKVGEVVWTTPRGDYEVMIPGEGGPFAWFRENVEPTHCASDGTKGETK